MTAARRWGAAADVPVFVARGLGGGRGAAELRAIAGLRLVDSPRHATVLLATGEFVGRMDVALSRIHDQLPHPRGMVWWRPPNAVPNGAPIVVDVPSALRTAEIVRELADVGAALRNVHSNCLTEATTTADIAPDRPPNDFAGRGGNGQGGDGMMGGVPWGRPMAMTADDRDGLALDRLAITFGPFSPGFPPGLFAEVQLQGEIVQAATLEIAAVDPSWSTSTSTSTSTSETSARHLLHGLSDLAWTGGLAAAAIRAARLAGSLEQLEVRAAIDELGRLRRQFHRSGLLRQWRGIGRIDPDRHDVATRITSMLDSCAADLAGVHVAAASFGRCSIGDLGRALIGMAWGDAVVTIASVEPLPDRGADSQSADAMSGTRPA